MQRTQLFMYFYREFVGSVRATSEEEARQLALNDIKARHGLDVEPGELRIQLAEP